MNQNFSKTYKMIGANIKSRRLQLQLTQLQLANKIPKMDRSKISDMENGKEDFMFSKLLQICEALDISLTDLINYKNE